MPSKNSEEDIQEYYTPEELDEGAIGQVVDEAPTDEEASYPRLKPINWSAREYVQEDKNPLWYVLFGVVVVGLITLDMFVIKSYTFSVLVAVMAIALVMYARREPREIQYALSVNQGLYVGEKLYHFDDFKAFGLIQDGDNFSVMLIPRKRFAPGVSVYFPEEAGEKIVDIFGARLPMQELKLDVIDVLVRKLRL
jgi:hypothetical protein